MKKLIVSLGLVSIAGLAQAQHWHHHNYYATGPLPHRHVHVHRHNNTELLGALAIGGLVGYALTRPTPQVVEQPVYVERRVPVYVERPQTVYVERQQPVCTQWREIQGSDGQIYRERICNQ